MQPGVEDNEINYGESSLEAESSSRWRFLRVLSSDFQTASIMLIDYKVEHSSISHPTMHHKLSSARRNRIEEFSAFCFIVSPQFTSFYYTIKRSNLATSIKIERKRELFNSTVERKKTQWRPYKPIGDIKKIERTFQRKKSLQNTRTIFIAHKIHHQTWKRSKKHKISWQAKVTNKN